MNKKGFTLVELLVVIAIIAVLSLLVIPNVISINKNVNERLYSEKQDEIVNAAQLYGSDNPEIFNGRTSVDVYVSELIDKGYVSVDTTVGKNCNGNTASTTEDNQSSYGSNKGCVLSPVDKTSMNADYVTLYYEAIGIIGKYTPVIGGGPNPGPEVSTPKTLVEAVCSGLSKGSLIGKTYGGKECKCNGDKTGFSGEASGAQACIIVGNEPNNYLSYGNNNTMWRVVGLYVVDGKLSAKIITNNAVN